jgi:hypothetical protein
MAQQCAQLGGRIASIEHLTGLPVRDFKHWLFADHEAVPRGRAPSSIDWLYRRATLLDQAVASVLMSIYTRLRAGGFQAEDALIGAYKHHLDVCGQPDRISFDRAFDLASHFEGRWLAQTRSLDVVSCRTCHGDHLAPLGSIATFGQGCPFCGLRARYINDPRLQSLFPASPPADIAGLELGLMALMRTGAPPADIKASERATPSSAAARHSSDLRDIAASVLASRLG